MKKTLKYLIPILALTMTTNSINAEGKGVVRANLDESVAPGQDFYQYACGGWMKNNPLPAQYSRFGTMDQLSENSREQVKSLVQHLGETNPAQGSIAQKVNDLYEMGMDRSDAALATLSIRGKSKGETKGVWRIDESVSEKVFFLPDVKSMKSRTSPIRPGERRLVIEPTA